MNDVSNDSAGWFLVRDNINDFLLFIIFLTNTYIKMCILRMKLMKKTDGFFGILDMIQENLLRITKDSEQ